MTLPTLIQNQQKKQFLNQAKVVYTILNNAIEASKVKYGTDINNWELFTTGGTLEQSMYFTEKFLIPNLKIVEYCKDKAISKVCTHKVSGPSIAILDDSFSTFTPSDDSGTTFALANSAIVGVQVGNIGDAHRRIRIKYDVNGTKKPNFFGKDVFFIELGGGVYSSENRNKNIFLPYMYDSSQPCEYYTTSSELGKFKHRCAEGDKRSACLAYIMCSGWDMPDDYPW